MADDRFRISTEELKDLMEFRGAEAAKQLQDLYGGVEKLCDALGTSPTDGMTGQVVIIDVTSSSGALGNVPLDFQRFNFCAALSVTF